MSKQMKRKIYHGSSEIIEKPEFGYGKPYNDYGLGFYCTEQIDMAREWGVSKGLKILNLNDEKYCILHWLSILLENREFEVSSALAAEAKEYILKKFKIEYEEYDAIVGYRADDSYFSFAQDFINGAISYRQLNRAMHLGKLGQQFVLKSKKAFQQIEFTGYESAASKEWYRKKMLRDRSARREYFDVERNKRQKGDLYIIQIMDEEMKSDDLCLR